VGSPAMAPDTCSRIVRFGLFELDLTTGELRKKGGRVRLQEQPFQVLAMLVQRPGDLVTREELRARLWPDAVFVDFDQGLNKAVTKIRSALGDLAASPRFVETLERRGYRFIAPVELVGSLPRPATSDDARVTVVRLVCDDRSVPVGEGTHVIGRDPGAAIWVDSSLASRRHAALVVTPASITVEDLGSRNGTFVNGARIDAVSRLVHGDELRVGPARFIVHAASAGQLTVTAPSDSRS
jgi:DNA-binding winged helix-turn-helix (wHTH) protein